MRKPLRLCLGLVLLLVPAASQAAAPVANDDSYDVAQDDQLNVGAPGVLGNDTDADGDPLTASVVSDPLYGTLTLNADGSFTYRPNAGFAGNDSYSYAADDGTSTSEAVVSLTVTGYGGGYSSGGGYGGGGAPSAALLAVLALAALYPRGLKPSKRRAISP